MKASDLSFQTMTHFSAGEWPGGVLTQMDAEVIKALCRVRNRLPRGHTWTPSPLPRGHVREEPSGSRHSTQGGNRLSDATDGFVRWPHLWRWWTELQREPALGGIGVYVDMIWNNTFRERPMLHIDCRTDRILWVAWRDDRNDSINYTYLHSDPARFFELLAERHHGKG